MGKGTMNLAAVLVVLVGCRDGPTIPVEQQPSDQPQESTLSAMVAIQELVGDPLVVDLIEGIEDRTTANKLKRDFRELVLSSTIRDLGRLSELLTVLRSHPMWSAEDEVHPNDQVALAVLNLVLDDAALLLTTFDDWGATGDQPLDGLFQDNREIKN